MFTDTLYIRMFFIQLLSLVSIMAQQPSRTLSAVDAELASICGEASSPYAERLRLIHRLPSEMQEAQETVLVAPTVYGTSIEFARSVVEFSATYHRFPSGG